MAKRCPRCQEELGEKEQVEKCKFCHLEGCKKCLPPDRGKPCSYCTEDEEA